MKLTPLNTLVDRTRGGELPLPDRLRRYYGGLRFPVKPGKPYLFANFVSTLDGVVTLGVPGHESGGDISGHHQDDRVVMGLLRSAADVVLITAGSLRVSPGRLWTGEDIFPALAREFRRLRENLGKERLPLHAVVTASGALDLDLPLFQTGAVRVLIITGRKGRRALAGKKLPDGVRVAVTPATGSISGPDIVKALGPGARDRLILVEGGPHLVGTLFKARRLDELFLTLSPQIAGRDGLTRRYGFAEGVRFAPDDPLWGRLQSLKRAGEFLFLRYRLPSEPSLFI